MKAEAFVVIPKVKSKGTEVEMEMLPLVQCKDCKFHIMRGDMLLCKAMDKPHTYDWFCGDGVMNDD